MQRIIFAIVVLLASQLALAEVGYVKQFTSNTPYKPGSKTPVVVKPHQFKWKTLPSGVQVAYIEGNPKKAGPFIIRLKYPPGFRKGPHYHLGTAFVTVLSGSYYRGYGTVFDKSKAVKLTAGTFSVNPAGAIHYEWSTGPAVIQVNAIGPWKTVYVNAKGQSIPMNKVKHATPQHTM